MMDFVVSRGVPEPEPQSLFKNTGLPKPNPGYSFGREEALTNHPYKVPVQYVILMPDGHKTCYPLALSVQVK